MTRIVFMGSPAFAVPSLTALCERPDLGEVVGVVTQPDKPAGRGHKLTPPPVKVAAAARGLPVWQPTKVKTEESLEALRALRPDLVVVAAYGRILPKSWLELPRHGCVNVHASLLPRHRGASPISQAILAGDSEAGVAIMRMAEGLDTGPVYGMKSLPIAPDDTTGTLTVKLAELGGRALVELLPQIVAGVEPTPQDEARATYAPLIDKEHAALDFDQPATLLERQVRAFNPWPLAYAKKGGARLQILAAKVARGAGRPGEILAADAGGVLVACGEGALLLATVKPEGRPAMPASAWAAGRGAAVGERLEHG